MKLTIDNTIVSEVKVQEGTQDLNCDYEFDILGEEKYNAAWEEDFVNTIHKGSRTDQYPFSIAKLREILDTLEKNECNYVSIDYNCDHPDYTFYGVDIHVATQDEIDEFTEKERQKELKQVEDALKKLEKEKERILKQAESLKK